MSDLARTPWRRLIRFPEGYQYTTESWVFAVVSDPHCTPTPSSIRHGHGLEHLGDGAARLQRCFDAIAELAPEDRPQLILLLGDIGLSDAEKVLESPPCPIRPVAGNYECGELRERLRALYPEQLGASDYYAFTHEGVRFIGLCNAGIGNEHVGQLASEGIRPPGQSGWLTDRLTGPWMPSIVFAHCPPEPPGFDRPAYLERSSHDYLPFMGENDSRFFLALLRDRGPILSLAGHQHRPTYGFDVAESHVMVVRSCNWNHDEAPVGFLLVRVDGRGLSACEIITGRCRHG